MPLTIAGRHRRRVRFPAANLPPAITSTPGIAAQEKHQQQQHQQQPQLGLQDHPPFQPTSKSSKSAKVGKSRKSTTSSGMATQHEPRPGIPSLFTQPPPIRDPLTTETVQLQETTLEKCLTFLKGLHPSQTGPFNAAGVPALLREDHVAYLYESLEDYPAGFVAMDASRPWMVYWALAGLTLLGENPTHFRERVLGTLRPMQNATGGFGGGHGQTSHLASSYAAVLALAMVGGAEAFALIEREAMWRWLGRLKQADGGFSVTEGGEEDVRGAYCASTIIALLDIPLALPSDAKKARDAGFETLTEGVAEYLSRCQSFEGGISGSPGVEAHGAYAFCALACLSILGAPEETIPKHMNIPLLLSWLSARQYAPEGGFSGRTNKLVDGCYSHWVGGCWPLLQSALDGKPQTTGVPSETVGSLFSREGLDRYILGCCQTPTGGLRDKPGKSADSYHTCYVLTGLSATQHYHYRTNVSVSPGSAFESAFSWRSSPMAAEEEVYEPADRLVAFHPLFVIPHQAAANLRLWCESHPISV